MAKKTISGLMKERDARLRRILALLFAGLIVLQVAIFYGVIALVWGESYDSWLPELLLASAVLLAACVLTLIIAAGQQRKSREQVSLAIRRELRNSERTRNQLRALEAMAAAVSSARNVESVLDVTLDVYQLVLSDLGIPEDRQAAAALLLDDDDLVVLAARGFVEGDVGLHLNRRQGILARTLSQAELSVSKRPDQDPVLSSLPSLSSRELIIGIPLHAAHGLYGLIILALDEPLTPSGEDRGVLEAIADQAAMALHNFQVLQDLDLTRHDLLQQEEDERRLYRRTLHEGPLRSVAAVALRLGLIRTMMIKDPDQASSELRNMEAATLNASQELRTIVSLLRPLALDVEDLEKAVETTLRHSGEALDLELRFGQRASGEGLNEAARGVILYVIEETLVWARKHGQATAAEIDLWHEDDFFQVSIRDNGVAQGAGEEKTLPREQYLDYRLMQVKVGRLNGSLTYESAAGRGAQTHLSLPLGQQEFTAG